MRKFFIGEERMIYKEKLKFLRERYGYTQKKIAELIHVSSDGYGQYENEKYIIPIKHLNTICNYFNVSIDYVFSFTNKLNYNNSRQDINKELSQNRLKEFRKTNKLTQDKLSKLLNVSRTTITEYERGINIIATPFLYTICKEYKISADYLLGKIDEKV